MLTSYAFGYYTPGKNSVENNILFIKDFKDKYILGTPSGFHLFDPVRGNLSLSLNLQIRLVKLKYLPIILIMIIIYGLEQRKRTFCKKQFRIDKTILQVG